MQKKLVLVGILATTIASAAHADLFRVSANGGYSTVTMADSNKRDSDAKAQLDALGGVKTTLTPLSGGWFVGAEAGLGLMPFLDLGPRVEYLQTNQGGLTVEAAGNKFIYTVDTNLSSFMLGANVGVDLPLTGLGFSAGIYGGYGYAVAKRASSLNNVPFGGGLYSGGGFVGELQAKLKYSIIPLLSIDLLAGIRLANVGKLKDGDKESQDAFDFSGFNAGGGLTLGF